jgi:antitoxin PrlF
MPGSKLSAEGQITVPKEIGEILKLEPGDLVVYEIQGGEFASPPAKSGDYLFNL